ncbi:MAG: hypothetical protein EOO65_02505, partial [Methanosarcinales archaeon]
MYASLQLMVCAAVLACVQGSGTAFNPQSPNVITTYAGNGTAKYGGDGGPAAEAALLIPWGLAAYNNTTSGVLNVFIAGSGSNLVRLVSGNPGNISTYAGMVSQANGGIGGSYSGDGGPATGARMYNPDAVATVLNASSGGVLLYIADTKNFVIRKVNEAGNISTVAGCPPAGCPSGFVTPAALATQIDNPTGVAAMFNTTTAGVSLYISDAGNSVVLRVDEVGNAHIVAGQSGSKSYSGDGGAAVNATLNTPISSAPYVNVSTGGVILFIADGGSCTIRRVGEDGIISTVAGIDGNATYAGDGGPATAATLNGPYSVAVLSDAQGRLTLFIADFYNNVIRFVDAGGIISTVVGNGTQGYSGDGGDAKLATLNGPSYVLPIVLGVGGPTVFAVSDQGNNVIRLVEIVQINASSTPSPTPSATPSPPPT